jgi:hypothetical protein
MRAVYAVLGLVAAAWLGLYLSSRGALIHSEPVPHVVRMHADFTGDMITATLPPDTLRCTYLTAIGFRSVDYPLASRQVCPRLGAFGQ